MVRKSLLRHWGLDEEWTRSNVTKFLRDREVVPYWDELHGELLFQPAVFGKRTRKKAQDILGVRNKEEADLLRAELSEKTAQNEPRLKGN
jgi:hypothetical protein